MTTKQKPSGKILKKEIDISRWGEKIVRPYKEGSYCEERLLKQMGFTAADNTVPLYCEGRYGRQPVWAPLFREDDKDNIEITVYDLDRNIIQFLLPEEKKNGRQRQSDNDVWIDYTVVRLNKDNIKDGQGKYRFPSADMHEHTYPYIPIPLLEKWERREHIETLVLTEGYFKALTGCREGINVVGLGSITLFEDKTTNSIYRDIDRLIKDCQVDNIVILYDGDCTDISTKDLERKEELTRRPRTFLNSLKRLFKLLKGYKSNVWFMYVDSKKLLNSPKGLDDLLLDSYHKTRSSEIAADINDPEAPSTYFFKLNLRKYHSNLQETFFLDNNADFYRVHKQQIGEREFCFNGNIYQWQESKHRLEEVISKELSAYIRVGTHYYKNILVPTQDKEKDGSYRMEHELQPWSREAIKDDFGVEALGKIRKYERFVNIPSHTDYHAVINNCYNIYHPMTQRADGDPARKNWQHIDMIIEHIFGKRNEADKNAYSQYDMGMDYIQIMYQYPTHFLPILCLVSSERNTGKTSFAEMLRCIFDRNVVIVGSKEMMSNFNTLTTGRLVVALEEMKADDNKAFTERLKFLSTAQTVPMEGNGKDAVMVANCTKYIICSNNTTRFIYTNEKEERFWVRKVSPISPDNMIEPKDLMRFIRREVPAFLTYLNQRELSYPKERGNDRMWFKAEDRWTPWLQELFNDQRSPAEKAIREWLHQYFIDFARKEVRITAKALKVLIPVLNRDSDERIRRILKDILELKMSDNDGKTERFTIEYITLSDDTYSAVRRKYSDVGRPYIARAEQFLTKTEYKAVFESPAQPEERPENEPEIDYTNI